MAFNKRVLQNGNCYRADPLNGGIFTFRFYGYETVGNQKFIKCLKNHDNRVLLINPATVGCISHLDYDDPEEAGDDFDSVPVKT